MTWNRFALMAVIASTLPACAPSISTPRADIPLMQRGHLDIVVKSAGAVPPDEVSKARVQFKRSFQGAGFEPVETGEAGPGNDRALEIVLTKYDQSTPSKNPAVAAGVGCVYVCPLFAPCLLLPIYYEPQFEVSADVVLYDKGRRLFSAYLSERAVSSSNLIQTGNEEFRNELEELAVHNFTASLVGRIGEQKPSVRAQRP